MSSFESDFEQHEVEDLRERVNTQISQISSSSDLNFLLTIIHNLSTVKSFFRGISLFSRWRI